MKLDSIGSIVEITPYFGYLDDVYKLMRRLNRQSNEDLNKIWLVLSKSINRKIFNLQEYWGNDYASLLVKVPIIHTLFRLSTVIVKTEYEYGQLAWMLEKIKNPRMIKGEFWCILTVSEDDKK